VGTPGPFVAIHPGAAYGSAKRWLPERFAEVADALAEAWGARVVVLGSPEEIALAQSVCAAMRGPALNLAGRTTTRDLMAVLAQASCLVCNDSGPMHVAAALGVPVVAVFGPTDPRRTAPWSPRARVVRIEHDCSPCARRACDRGHACMLGVTAEAVIDAALELSGA